MTSTLLLGGARSGKSSRALQLAEATATDRLFVATAERLDEEMDARVAMHQAERGDSWSTLEEPLELVDVLEATMREGRVVVIDCLTLWLSNVMHAERSVDAEIAKLCAKVGLPGALMLVSNEVGLGLVPETSLGRRFRDEQGRLNQRVAAACDHVELVTAGIPLMLK